MAICKYRAWWNNNKWEQETWKKTLLSDTSLTTNFEKITQDSTQESETRSLDLTA